MEQVAMDITAKLREATIASFLVVEANYGIGSPTRG